MWSHDPDHGWTDKIFENLYVKETTVSSQNNPKKEKTLAVKAAKVDSSEEDEDVAYLTKSFQSLSREVEGYQEEEILEES